MKKTVILIIGVIFVASVFMVGLLYPEIDNVVKQQYIKKIEYVLQPGSIVDEEWPSTDTIKYYKNEALGIKEIKCSETQTVGGASYDAYISGAYAKNFTLLLEFRVAAPESASILLDGIVGNEFKYSIDNEAVAELVKTEDGLAKLTFKDSGTVYLTVTGNDGGGAKYILRLDIL